MQQKKKKKYTPSLKSLAEFQSNIDEQAEQERQYDEAMRAAVVEEARQALHRKNWRSAWEQLNKGIVSYLKGDSSQWMVENIISLDAIIDELACGKSLESLRDIDTWPTFLETRDKHHVSICKIVIEVWALVRFDGADADDLVKALDENETRQPIENAGFVRHIVENGGFPCCRFCGSRKAPAEIQSRSCEKCTQRDKASLRWLYIAIKCEHENGPTYTDGVIGHYPLWDRWRKRLLDYVGKVDDTDHELWKTWTTYVRREHGLDEDQFWLVQLDDAEALLPLTNADLLARDQHNAEAERLARIDAKHTEEVAEARWEHSWVELAERLIAWHLGNATNDELIDTIEHSKSLIASRGFGSVFNELVESFDAAIYKPTDAENRKAQDEYDNAREIAVLLGWLNRVGANNGRDHVLQELRLLNPRPLIHRAYQVLPLLKHGLFPKLCEVCGQPLPIIRLDRIICSECDHRIERKRLDSQNERLKAAGNYAIETTERLLTPPAIKAASIGLAPLPDIGNVDDASPKHKPAKRVATESLETMDGCELCRWSEIADLHLQWLENGRKPSLSTPETLRGWLEGVGYDDTPSQFKKTLEDDRTNKSRHGYAATGKTKTKLPEAIANQRIWSDCLKSMVSQRRL